VKRDKKVRFVQVPQHFPEISGSPEDTFDRQNASYYYLTSTLFNQVGGATSCGTNAVSFLRSIL